MLYFKISNPKDEFIIILVFHLMLIIKIKYKEIIYYFNLSLYYFILK